MSCIEVYSIFDFTSLFQHFSLVLDMKMQEMGEDLLIFIFEPIYINQNHGPLKPSLIQHTKLVYTEAMTQLSHTKLSGPDI